MWFKQYSEMTCIDHTPDQLLLAPIVIFIDLSRYIFTTVAAAGAAPAQVYLNLFVDATVDLNATVVEGTAQYPPEVYNATPPPAGLPLMPPVEPQPALRFVKLANGGYFPLTGDPHQPPVSTTG